MALMETIEQLQLEKNNSLRNTEEDISKFTSDVVYKVKSLKAQMVGNNNELSLSSLKSELKQIEDNARVKFRSFLSDQQTIKKIYGERIQDSVKIKIDDINNIDPFLIEDVSKYQFYKDYIGSLNLSQIENFYINLFDGDYSKMKEQLRMKDEYKYKLDSQLDVICKKELLEKMALFKMIIETRIAKEISEANGKSILVWENLRKKVNNDVDVKAYLHDPYQSNLNFNKSLYDENSFIEYVGFKSIDYFNREQH